MLISKQIHKPLVVVSAIKKRKGKSVRMVREGFKFR